MAHLIASPDGPPLLARTRSTRSGDGWPDSLLLPCCLALCTRQPGLSLQRGWQRWTVRGAPDMPHCHLHGHPQAHPQVLCTTHHSHSLTDKPTHIALLTHSASVAMSSASVGSHQHSTPRTLQMRAKRWVMIFCIVHGCCFGCSCCCPCCEVAARTVASLHSVTSRIFGRKRWSSVRRTGSVLGVRL